MIFRFEKSNTIIQWNGKGLALVKYDNTTCVLEKDGNQSRRQQHRAGSGSVPAICDTVWNIPVTGYTSYISYHIISYIVYHISYIISYHMSYSTP